MPNENEFEEEEYNKTEWNVIRKTHDNVGSGRLRLPNKNQMRTLKQYKDMSEEEFDEYYAQRTAGVVKNQEFEGRIQRKIAEFGKDYALDELNSNDKLLLRALAQAMINLEDSEIESYNIRSEGVSLDNITLLEKLAKMMSELRGDISRLQDDLKITRKIRKSDKEQSTITFLDDLKIKAKEFYRNRMSYIYCKKCNMLLATIWVLYPDNKNKIRLTCGRVLDNGELCGTVVDVTTKELLDSKGTNSPEVMPLDML